MTLSVETPFQILLIGDFSGREHRCIREIGDTLAVREVRQISRDNLDDVITAFDINLTNLFVTSVESATIQVREFSDLHPDSIYSTLSLFRKLRDLRERLQDNATFAAAAAEIVGWSSSVDEDTRNDPHPTSKPDAEEPNESLDAPNVLDFVLEASEKQRPSRQSSDSWKRLIQDIASPYVLPSADPQLPELLGRLDKVIHGLLRAILQHEVFRQIDVSWQATRLLIRRLETGPQLRIFIADISKQELLDDLSTSDELVESGFYRFLQLQSEKNMDGEPLAMIVGNYAFEPNDVDAVLLGRIAKVTAAVRSTFVASGSATSLVDSSNTEASCTERMVASYEENDLWQALRELPEAACVALAWPNVLTRLPYGAATQPIEAFDFEENGDAPEFLSLAWGNAAMVVAHALGEAFAESGWRLDVGTRHTIDGLPLYVADDSSDQFVCVQYQLDSAAVEALQAINIVPVVGDGQNDRVHLLGIVSLFGTPLLGCWDA